MSDTIYFSSEERFEIPSQTPFCLLREQTPSTNTYYLKNPDTGVVFSLTEKEYFAKLREAKQDMMLALAAAKNAPQITPRMEFEVTTHSSDAGMIPPLVKRPLEKPHPFRSGGDGMCADCFHIQANPLHDAPRKAPEKVDHPAHYGGGDNPFEHIKIVDAWGLDYRLGNATKYICRAGKKDSATLKEDLSKALWYINDRAKFDEQRNYPALTNEIPFEPKVWEVCKAWGLEGAEGASLAMAMEALERYLLSQTQMGRATALADAKAALQSALWGL